MENKLNSGAAFKNTYKSEGDSKPDYKGTVDVDGKPKEIALWVRTAKEKDLKYFSIKISEPYQKDQAPESDMPPAKLDKQQDMDPLPF